MAKNRNTFEKSRREVEKRRKQEDKRAKKKTKKERGPDTDQNPDAGFPDSDLPQV